MALASGQRIGPYEVTGSLGAGGMGEVYRATDTKLKRDVALKVLPDSVALDPERVARFSARRKCSPRSIIRTSRRSTASKTLAMSALVMELVEGPTLADRIARGPDSSRRGTADRQADRRGARSRARARHHPSRSQAREHQGHDDGTVKVLDFGLAKAMEPSRQRCRRAVSQSPTLTIPRDDAVGHDSRHRGVHEPGAGEGTVRSIGARTSGRSAACSTKC